MLIDLRGRICESLTACHSQNEHQNTGHVETGQSLAAAILDTGLAGVVRHFGLRSRADTNAHRAGRATASGSGCEATTSASATAVPFGRG